MSPIAGLLVFARTLGLGMTAPVLAAPGFGVRARIVLSIGLAAIVGPVVVPGMTLPAEWEGLVAAAVGELAVGAGLGMAAGLIIAGARQAGEVVGAQSGLSAAALFDPEAGDELTPLGHLYGLIALGVFLALEGPLMLVRTLAESYEAMPVGELSLSVEAAELAFGRVASALRLAVHAAAPAAIALTLAGAALGLIGRAAPSLPLATMALPVRYALGLLIAMLGAVALAGTIAVAWRAWPATLGG